LVTVLRLERGSGSPAGLRCKECLAPALDDRTRHVSRQRAPGNQPVEGVQYGAGDESVLPFYGREVRLMRREPAVQRAHRGQVWAESRLGEGSEFTVRLPVVR
jgi:hypothetical protein